MLFWFFSRFIVKIHSFHQMISRILNLILTVLIIFCVTFENRPVSGNNFSSESVLLNTDELDESALKYLAGLPVLPKINLKPILKKTHLRAFKSGCLETKGRYFVKSFECAIDTIEWSLQEIFKRFEEVFLSQHVQETIHNQSKELPLEILNVFNTHDKWMDRGEPLLNSGNKTTSASSQKLRTLDMLLDYFRKWYYIITCDKAKHSVNTNINDLQAELDKFYHDFRSYFGDKELFYRRCAAHLARSFILGRAVHHDLQRKIREEVFREENVGVPFEDLFFKIIPYWHFTEEQVAFLNIVRSIATQQESFSPLQSLFTRNRWTGTAELPAEPDYVCIPYDESDLCGHVNFMKTTKNTPVAYSFSSIIYTRRYITKPATILNLDSIKS